MFRRYVNFTVLKIAVSVDLLDFMFVTIALMHVLKKVLMVSVFG